MAQISERQGRMPNDAPNANGSNDSSEESSESLTSSETFEAFNSLDSIHISASAPDGEANEVRIFSKKHAKELCPNDAAANEDPEREERYKRAQMTRPGFSVQGMQCRTTRSWLRCAVVTQLYGKSLKWHSKMLLLKSKTKT